MDTTILLVDDNADLLQVAEMVLKSQGYITCKAATVQQALAQIEAYCPSVILMDVDIAGEDGRALCDRLKNNTCAHSPRIILMSGDDGSFNSCTTADDYLAKPFDVGELIAKVEKQFSLLPA